MSSCHFQLPATVSCHCLNCQPRFPVTDSTARHDFLSLPQLPDIVPFHSLNCPHGFLSLPQLATRVSCHCLNCPPRFPATASTARHDLLPLPQLPATVYLSLPQLPVMISCHCLNWPQWLPVILLPQLPAKVYSHCLNCQPCMCSNHDRCLMYLPLCDCGRLNKLKFI